MDYRNSFSCGGHSSLKKGIDCESLVIRNLKTSIFVILLTVSIIFTGCIDGKSNTDIGTLTSQPNNSTVSIDSQTGQELFKLPDDYVIYQDYIQTIGGNPARSDNGIVEATIVSISRTWKCPYNEKNCSIEPYPRDTGIVKIDRIIQYTQYSSQNETGLEQPSGASSENASSVPGHKGPEYPSATKPGYAPLKEEKEFQSLFLVTARPVKIRYISINESENGNESMQVPDEKIAVITPGAKIFKPIIKDGDYFVLTTKIGKFPTTIEKVLPGLEVGSKFRAQIKYDGSLFIGEYEKIN